MTVDRSNFQILLEPRLRKIFFETYAEKPEEFSKYFNVKSSTKAKESDYHVAELGMWPEKDSQESTSYEDIQPGVEATYTHKTYSKGCRITEEMWEDEQYGVIDKMPKSIARGGRATVETTAATVLSKSFATNGYDGVPLFSESHPLYGNDGGTCDNLTDAKLTDAGIKELINLAKSQVNDAGLKIQVVPDHIVFHDADEFTVMTILHSAQVAGTANNDKNVLPKLTPIALTYLDVPTYTSAFFVFDSSLNELNFFWRKKPTFKSEKNFDTDVAKYKGKLRFSCGYSDWRGWAGSMANRVG